VAAAARGIGTDGACCCKSACEAAPSQTLHAQRVQAKDGQTNRVHCDGTPVHYERHRPEQTALYRLVKQHAQSFFGQTEAVTRAGLPQFVKGEFDA